MLQIGKKKPKKGEFQLMADLDDNATCGPEHKRHPTKHRRTYSEGQYGQLTNKEMYRVHTGRKMNDDYSVYLPLKRKLAKGFAQVACDYAIDKKVFEEKRLGGNQAQDFEAVVNCIKTGTSLPS